jgi:hypothetical protein
VALERREALLLDILMQIVDVDPARVNVLRQEGRDVDVGRDPVGRFGLVTHAAMGQLREQEVAVSVEVVVRVHAPFAVEVVKEHRVDVVDQALVGVPR